MKKKLMFLLGAMAIIAAIGAIFINIINRKEKDTGKAEEETIHIVATFYPVYMIGLNITDQVEGIDLKSLTDMNTGCLHDYQLTTEDMKSISNADILIINGGGMEAFLDDIIENYPNLTIIDTSSSIPMLRNEEDSHKVLHVEHDHDHDHEEEEEHLISEYNSHIWLNPSYYKIQVENVRKGLIKYIENNEAIDSEYARNLIQSIDKNTNNYLESIEDIDTLIEEELSNYISKDDSHNTLQAVIFHEAFAYLADRIGMEVAFTVPLDADSALSAGDIATIIDVVNEKKIKYLFIEEQFSDSIAKQIEAETDAKLYIIDSVVTGNGSKDSYIKAMKGNIEVLKEALGSEGSTK